MNARQRRNTVRALARQWPQGKRVVWNPYAGRRRAAPTTADYRGTVETISHLAARYNKPLGGSVLVVFDEIGGGRGSWCYPQQLRSLPDELAS